MNRTDRLTQGVLLLVAATMVVACSPAAPAEPPPSTPTVVAAPTPSPQPTVELPTLYVTVTDANAAFARKDFSTALRLYRRAASDNSLNQPLVSHPTPPGPELRAFARFRIVVTDALVAQEDDARETLEQMRREDTSTAFLRLALVFWDTYGMTADPTVACNQVTRLVQAQPEPVLRSLNNWGASRPDLAAEDICELP